jgi:dolichol-phosphate mannosyltransferase
MITENGFACQAEWLIKLGRLAPRVVELPLLLRYDRKPTPSKMPVLRTIGATMALLRRLRKLK